MDVCLKKNPAGKKVFAHFEIGSIEDFRPKYRQVSTDRLAAVTEPMESPTRISLDYWTVTVPFMYG